MSDEKCNKIRDQSLFIAWGGVGGGGFGGFWPNHGEILPIPL